MPAALIIDSKPSPTRIRRLQANLHGRLAEPFVTILFAILALPLALRVETTRSLGMPAVYGLATIGAFYLVRGTSATLAVGGLVPAALAPWLVLGFFGTWSAVALIRIPR